MKQEKIETTAKQITQKAKEKLATNNQVAEGAVIKYKDVTLGLYYLATTSGNDEIYVGICNKDAPQGMMLYYAVCNIKDGVEVNREILQSADSIDNDYSQYNALLIEVLNRFLGATL